MQCTKQAVRKKIIKICGGALRERLGAMKKWVMALDQGTTSSRCILFDKSGNICSSAQKEFAQHYPKPGWVEHDPMEIWASQFSVMSEAMSKMGATAENIAAIGITNQRETTIVWNKENGRPVYPAIVWQCRRTSARVDKLIREGMSDRIREKTGLVPDAYFSATKIEWILDNVPGAREDALAGRLLFGTVDSWLVWKLTGGRVHVTDRTNASRTMLFNIHTLDWDEELLQYFNIPRAMLPQVKPSSFSFAQTDPELTGRAIPIAGIAGDQQAALFGQCCFEAGDVKNTYGTGCFLLMNTGEHAVKSEHGLVTTVAAGVGEKPSYAIEGSVFVAGAAIQWLRDELWMIRSAAETEEICKSVEDSAGAYLVPAFTGLGAPYWDQYARGTFVGMTRGMSRAHFVRAAVESLAYQVTDVLEAMEQDSGYSIEALKADGGASANNFLLQFQADVLDASVERPGCIETTALGAAYLAGLAVGYWKDKQEIRANWRLERSFSPSIGESKRRSLLKGWRRAVRCALFWAQDTDEA